MRHWKRPDNHLQQAVNHGDDFDEQEGTAAAGGFFSGEVCEFSLAKAADLLGISGRQAERIWGRYRDEGDTGLVRRAC